MFNKSPCPFCGERDQKLSFGTTDREGTPCAMNCTACGCVGPWVYVSSDATPGTMMFKACEEWDKRITNCEWSEIEDASGIYNTCKKGEKWHLPEGLELYPFCHWCGREIEVVELSESEGEQSHESHL